MRTLRRLRLSAGKTRPNVDAVASTAGAVAAAATAAAIYLGSRSLLHFDAALIGYATATVFLAFGVVYRYVVWVQSPPARRYLIRGWRSFLSWRNFRRFPTMVPRALVSNLALQTFIGKRGRLRWLAHQSLFWGVVGATLITFPLTFGWLHFEAAGSGSRYVLEVWGLRTVTFDPISWVGWVMFHALDATAVLVLLGCGYFLWRRFRDREASTGQRLGYDFFPLVALVAISVTGLLLTFDSLVLEGQDYAFLAIVHMSVVVLTLVFIPFGKFFHVIQRPASIGVDMVKRTDIEREGVLTCRRCGAPLEGVRFVKDLETTMEELGLRFGGWVETCPRCKRIQRGESYLRQVKGGFQ
ncbi:MAG TPA: MFS transporter [Actinomycetota bacterium]|nr:MFS transporter [Actinomycetota bacterium]